MLQEIQPKTANGVAAILEQELDSMISEWKRQVSLAPSLTNILLSDADRTGHLPKLLDKVLSDHPKPATDYHLKTGQRE
jgi:hypothetical protein